MYSNHCSRQRQGWEKQEACGFFVRGAYLLQKGNVKHVGKNANKKLTRKKFSEDAKQYEKFVKFRLYPSRVKSIHIILGHFYSEKPVNC